MQGRHTAPSVGLPFVLVHFAAPHVSVVLGVSHPNVALLQHISFLGAANWRVIFRHAYKAATATTALAHSARCITRTIVTQS
jgi:hypothetical protein